MPITPLPQPPSRSDPANFPERADAFMAALPLFAQQANTLQQQVNQKEQDVANSATAAANSAEQAAASAASASQHADGAARARNDAQGSAVAASASAAQAQGYFEEMQGKGGLPVFTIATVPTSNIGAIYVTGTGPMEWNAIAGAYVPMLFFNECRLDGGVAANSIKLSRYNGSRLTIGTRTHIIPETGIEIVPVVPPGVLNYVYAWYGDGGINLEYGTTPHVEDPITGRRVKNGDPSKLLVGMLRKDENGSLLDNTSGRGVASQFNRQKKIALVNQPNASTSSVTPVMAVTNRNALYWRNGIVIASMAGTGTTSSALNPGYAQIMNTGLGAGHANVCQPNIANQSISFFDSVQGQGSADGNWQANIAIRVTTSSVAFSCSLYLTVETEI